MFSTYLLSESKLNFDEWLLFVFIFTNSPSSSICGQYIVVSLLESFGFFWRKAKNTERILKLNMFKVLLKYLDLFVMQILGANKKHTFLFLFNQWCKIPRIRNTFVTLRPEPHVDINEKCLAFNSYK